MAGYLILGLVDQKDCHNVIDNKKKYEQLPIARDPVQVHNCTLFAYYPAVCSKCERVQSCSRTETTGGSHEV